MKSPIPLEYTEMVGAQRATSYQRYPIDTLRGKSKFSLLKNLDFLLNADTPIYSSKKDVHWNKTGKGTYHRDI